jgi:hypothetical protein
LAEIREKTTIPMDFHQPDALHENIWHAFNHPQVRAISMILTKLEGCNLQFHNDRASHEAKAVTVANPPRIYPLESVCNCIRTEETLQVFASAAMAVRARYEATCAHHGDSCL